MTQGLHVRAMRPSLLSSLTPRHAMPLLSPPSMGVPKSCRSEAVVSQFHSLLLAAAAARIRHQRLFDIQPCGSMLFCPFFREIYAFFHQLIQLVLTCGEGRYPAAHPTRAPMNDFSSAADFGRTIFMMACTFIGSVISNPFPTTMP